MSFVHMDTYMYVGFLWKYPLIDFQLGTALVEHPRITAYTDSKWCNLSFYLIKLPDSSDSSSRFGARNKKFTR